MKPLRPNAAHEYQFADLLKVEELSLELVVKTSPLGMQKGIESRQGERRQLRSGRVKDSS
jgi:hypothetical protein